MHPEDWHADEAWDENLDRDVAHLKMKQDAGAHYVVDQMIFDAGLHFRFVKEAREDGVTIPIIPGILAFEKYTQAARFVGPDLHILMPRALQSALQGASEEDQTRIALDHMAEQVRKLLKGGVPGIHFYCMNRAGPTIELLRRAAL